MCNIETNNFKQIVIRTTVIFLILISTLVCNSQTFNYARTWSTYYSDDSIRVIDNEIDSQGNIYIVGSVNKQDYLDSSFAPTDNAYQIGYGGGRSDGFITKFSSAGNLIWATYVGGEKGDVIKGITIDSLDNIYIIGTTSSAANIASANAYQSTISGIASGFVGKFSSTGARIWSTYYGANYNIEVPYDDNQNSLANRPGDLVCDEQGNAYIIERTQETNLATNGAFQSSFNLTDGFVLAKFSPLGVRIWATYYGINMSEIKSMSINTSGLYIAGVTNDCPPFGTSNNYFATAGAYQAEAGGCVDTFMSKFDFEGNRLWSTYYGNNFPESMGKASISAFPNGVFLTFSARGSTYLSTPGSFQESVASNTYSTLLAKFNSDGVREWATYYGDYYGQEANGDGFYFPTVNVDFQDNVYLSSITRYLSNISTSGSYQETNAGIFDCFVAKFTPTGDRLWGTFYGGANNEFPPLKTLTYGNDFYIMGMTNSAEGISTPGSYQPDYATNVFQPSYFPSNVFIAKFGFTLDTQQFAKENMVIYPNPVLSSFIISNQSASIHSFEFAIYDITGRVLNRGIANFNQQINIEGLSSGNYIVKIAQGSKTETFKLIKK